MSKNNRPISPQQLQQLAQLGRGGDTMIAHINPEEAEMLKRMGGSGTINPQTGLREFAFADDSYFYVNQDGGDGGWDFGGGGYNDYYDYGGGLNMVDVDMNGSTNTADNLSGSINNGVNNNLVTIPIGGGTATTDTTGSVAPGEITTGNITDTTGLDTGDVIPGGNITDTTGLDTGDVIPDTGGTGTTIDTNITTGAVTPTDIVSTPTYTQADVNQALVDYLAANPDADRDTVTALASTLGITGDQVNAAYTNLPGPVTPDIITGTGANTVITDTTGGGANTVVTDFTGGGANTVVTDFTGGGANTVITDITTGGANVIDTVINGTGNLVQIGDDTYLDTTTGAVVTSTGNIVLAPIVTDITTGTNVAVANIGSNTVTDTGNIQIGLTGVGNTQVTSADQLTGQSQTVYNDLETQYQNLLTQRDALINGDYTPDQILALNYRIGDLLRIQDSILAGTFDFDANPYPGRNVDYIVDTVLGTQYAYDKDTGETLGPTITYNGQVGVGNVIIQDQDFSGNTANLSGSSAGGNITYSNVVLGDANVANVTGGSNANITMNNVTGGNLTGVNGPVVPGTGNITITDSTMGNVANIDTTTSNLTVGNATTSNITNINSTLTTSNIANTIANNISNSTSNVSDTNISNTFANTIANVLSTISNANISNTVVGNISNSLSNIANTNISNTQANNISNVITLFTDGNISNSIVNNITNSISNINNANISNTVVNNVANVISTVTNSNISNTVANIITNSVSNLSNVVISNSIANLISNVSSNIANIVVANSTANIANIITTGNTLGNGNIIITANTLANANVIANVLANVVGNSNANTNANVVANIITNANVISNVLTNANVISNVLTNANVISNVLTNANVISNVLTNANVISNVLTNANVITNVISNVANVTSNVANVPYTGNIILGTGLNPGFMAPTAFYNTNDPAQSQFNWGSGGYQPGPTFNEVLYNQAAAPATPFGLQQMAKPLTSQQIQDLIAGKEITTPTVAPATRKQAYAKGPVAPTFGQVMLNPSYKGTAVVPGTNSGGTTDAQFKQISDKLGPNWASDLQRAATNGDWAEYNRIQQEVNSILNPVIDRY